MALDDILDLFVGQQGSTVGFCGVGGLQATPPKNQVTRVQDIRPKWTWLEILDSHHYQNEKKYQIMPGMGYQGPILYEMGRGINFIIN